MLHSEDEQEREFLFELESINKIGIEIEKDLKKIESYIKETPLSTLEAFKTYIEPKRNLDKIIYFYDLFLKSAENIYKQQEKIEIIKNKEIVKEEFDKEIKIIKCLEKIKGELFNFKKYQDIHAVKKFCDEVNKNVNLNLEMLEKSFFKYIGHQFPNMNYKTKICNLSNFLYLNREKSIFVKKYVDLFIIKYGSRKIENKYIELVNRVICLHEWIEEVKKVNDFLFEEDITGSINKEILEKLMLELKVVISHALMDIDRKNKPENLIYLIKLYSSIKIKENIRDTNMEMLFEFKKECLVLINNLLITFEQNIIHEKKNEKNFLCEQFNKTFLDFCDTFKENNNCLEELIFKFQENFAFENYDSFVNYYGVKCLRKTFDLSENLKGIQKCVYLLNNLDILQEYILEYKNIKIIEYLERNKNDIIKIWKNECEKRKHKESTEFLKLNLSIQRKYILPDLVRENIISQLSKIIFNLVSNSKYREHQDDLKNKINELFSGKE
ncbi:hypothetical protein CWI36_0613p0010 [Hamiltosporidium magnivora]|uniref:Uncharacterized protein n=1 Tax=Hamiltosporidium magnivora TaxID=148818 RepID=A0A4Q9LCI3_9MICR|nr:hypothetical protein CWI36_0613p0010 [Hamiltosporidium magnivora]